MFGRGFRNLGRLYVIARTFARYDILGSLIELGAAPRLLAPLSWLADRHYRDLRPGQRFSLAAQALGPTYIKLGQALATRSDLVGEIVAGDLSSLQDRLPPFPTDQARAVIEADLGRPMAEMFRHFEDVPVAAASIAQVHFAETSDGAKVAVKVLRPGIEKQFTRDLELFSWIAEMLERFQPKLRRLKPRQIVETIAGSIRLEMDLRFEAAAAAELADNFVGDPGFRVPKVDWERTAKRVMTQERVEGIRIDDRAALEASGLDIHAVLTHAAASFFNQVFRDGFFHADMHPGNLFVAPDGAVVAVDFGIMGRLDWTTRLFLADMLVGFLTGDYRRVAQVHFDAGYVPANQSVEAFTQACRSIGEPLMGKPLNEISVGRLLAQLLEITETFQMETQPQLLLLQKTMLVAEGVGRALDPAVNMWELAQPLIEQWIRANRGPEARIKEAALEGLDALRRLPRLVGELQQMVEDAKNGGLRLHPATLQALADAQEKRAATPWPVWVLGAVVVLALLT